MQQPLHNYDLHAESNVYVGNRKASHTIGFE